MNKQRFNYLNKFQQFSQTNQQNKQITNFHSNQNNIPSSRTKFQYEEAKNTSFIQDENNFENFGTFNHHENQVQQFQSIKLEIQQYYEPCFSKISQNPSQFSETIHQHHLIKQKNISNISYQEKLLIDKRKSIIEGFSRTKTLDNKDSFVEQNNKNQNQIYLPNSTSRLTQKKSCVINDNFIDNEHQEGLKKSKSSVLREYQDEKYGQNSLQYQKGYNKNNQIKICSSQITHTLSNSQEKQAKQCKSSVSPSRKYESSNASQYLSSSEQNLELMKNFIENKSQQVKDLEGFLVKQFEQIENQKQKYRKSCLRMEQLLKQAQNTKNQHLQYKKFIELQLTQFQKTMINNVEGIAKRFTKQFLRLKIQSDQKTQIIKLKQTQIFDLLKKVKDQQQKIQNLNTKLAEKKDKIQNEQQVNKIKEVCNKKKPEIFIGSITTNIVQQIVQQAQIEESGSKFERSKSKKNKYDYFGHFQKELNKQGSNSKLRNACEFNVKSFDSPVRLQDDYDHRLQRLLQQVEERQKLVKNKKSSNGQFCNNYNKNFNLLSKNYGQKSLSPLKQSNNQSYQRKTSPTRSPSRFSPKNKSISISNFDKQRSIKKKQECFEPQNIQIFHDRKKYIKDKIEKIKLMKDNEKNTDIYKYQYKSYQNQNNMYGPTKTPSRANLGYDYSPSKNPIHIKSTYVFPDDRVYQKQQSDLSHSYSQSKIGSSLIQPKNKHSNAGYQYLDRGIKNKSSMGLGDYSKDDRLTPSKSSSVYMMGMNNKNITRF